jgi:hypothetical protein
VTLIQGIIEILLWPGGGDIIIYTRSVPETLMEINHLEEVGVEWRIILNCIFRNGVF